MELKKTYITPEAELLCFEPVENIANGFALWSNGSGLTPDPDGSLGGGVDIPVDGESTSPTLDPDGEW